MAKKVKDDFNLQLYKGKLWVIVYLGGLITHEWIISIINLWPRYRWYLNAQETMHECFSFLMDLISMMIYHLWYKSIQFCKFVIFHSGYYLRGIPYRQTKNWKSTQTLTTPPEQATSTLSQSIVTCLQSVDRKKSAFLFILLDSKHQSFQWALGFLYEKVNLIKLVIIKDY